MKPIRTLALGLAAASLASVLQATPATAADKVLATVNGQPITESTFEQYKRMRLGNQRGAHPLTEQQKQKLLDELINRELIYQDAVRAGYDKDPEVQKELAELKRNLYTSIRIRRLLAENPPSEADMRAMYDEQVQGGADKEYKARHILVKTEEEAREIIKELRKGADFAQLAKERSIGPSGKHGGDLGWFSGSQMVKPFADAVAQMKPGEFSRIPVQTQFGWHVIKLEEVRDVEPPSFEQVRGQIETIVQDKTISDYIQSLKSKAEIDIKAQP